MNFDLTEDQSLLKAAVERFVTDRYGGDIERRRGYRAEPSGFSAENWRMLADLGLLGLTLPEDVGGLGGGRVELITAFEALGRGLVVEPVLDALVAGALLGRAGTAAQRADWLPRLIAGEGRLALAHPEAAARFNLAHVATTARAAGDGFVLTGEKTAVLGGADADGLIVSARLKGGLRDRDGIGFFLVPGDAAGVHRRGYRIADGGVAAEVVLRDVAVPGGARLAGGLDALENVAALARLAACAEMLGLAGLLLDATVGYAKTRQQFGQPLGKFQVLAHRLTDAYVAVEQARGQVLRAALSSEDGLARAAAAAKAFVTEAAMSVAHTAVQVHGGMGVTDELAVGHALKRIRVLALTFGDAEAALADYAEAA